MSVPSFVIGFLVDFSVRLVLKILKQNAYSITMTNVPRDGSTPKMIKNVLKHSLNPKIGLKLLCFVKLSKLF